MKRCRTCLYPDTKPDLHFDESGQCSACVSHGKRLAIDWDARKADLLQLLDRHHGECIVPSSGGKDSTWQVLKLLELGAHVTIVTATTCYLTPMGRRNIDNLARQAKTIEVTPNMTVRAKLNRLGLELVGDISWPEHVSIFTTPFRVAAEIGIPLIFFGECPQAQYGGPQGSDEALQMTRRWVSEYGGFLGLRPSDMVGQIGITERDMRDYLLPQIDAACNSKVEAHFLGQYFEWDSYRNADVAMRAGMECKLPSPANHWEFENIDNGMTGLHDHAMYRKYGFGRMCAQISVDIRNGRIRRDRALNLVEQFDGAFPFKYAGVKVEEVCKRIGMPFSDLMLTLDKFTNWALFDGAKDERPLLKGCA